MAYLALYRRFRPTDFESVIGQETIVKTLTNQIVHDKIGHAYLFCGARGTGKTSLAKIFARAVNCTETKNGSPCGKCEACKMLADPSNIDIVEMDAASNNKVENVREIRENVQYPPVGVKYKVYIIDEVHMLTTEAFNALLKTLEEPPKHAIFILATTEPHKLPATILSRCMRFDFKLISLEKITSLIKSVYDEVGKKYEEEAVKLIAKSGEGSVRDALSVADLCVSVGDKLTYQDVLAVLGATDLNKIDGLVKAVFKGDTGEVLSYSDELYSLGKSVGLLSKDVVNYLRDLAIIKTCKNAKDILALPEDRYNVVSKVADLVDEHRILRCIEIISEIENQLRYSTQPRAVLETALIKASMPENDYNFDALISRINALEEKLKNYENGAIGQKTVEKVVERVVEKVVEVPTSEVKIEPKTPIVEKVEEKPVKEYSAEELSLVPPPEEEIPMDYQPAKKVEEPIKKQETISAPAVKVDGKKCWGGIVRRLRTTPNKTILWVACQEMTASVDGDALTIYASAENEKKLLLNKDNYDTLLEIAKGFGIEKINVEINLGGAPSEDPLNKAKEFFGDTLKVK